MIVPLLCWLVAQSPAPTSYSVAGTVVDAASQQVVTKAKLFLTPASGAAKTVVTGPDGKFRFSELPAGKYTLAAERLGYPRQNYGARTLYARYSTGIVVGENQKTEDLVFRLTRGGVITGKVTEPGGEPVAGMTVNAMQIVGIGKGRRVYRNTTQTTDDRGVYRIPFQPRGKYIVLVTGRPHQEQARPTGQKFAYPATFAPGAPTPEGAAIVDVRHGQEAVADILISPRPAAQVVGQVPGNIPPNSYATLMLPVMFGYQLIVKRSPAMPGKGFMMDEVPPGHYLLSVTDDATRGTTSQPVDVVAPVTQVAVTETPAARVTAAVKGKVPDGASIVVQLTSVESGKITPQRSIANGVATFDVLTPGRYSARVMVNRKEAAVMEVKGPAVGAADLVITVPETGKAEFEVIVDSTAIDLKGKLLCDNGPCASGALAMLVKRNGWEVAGAYRFDQCSSDGSFTWTAVPAGDYLMFAFEDVDALDYDDPAVIRQLIPGAQALTVTGDSKQTVELYLTGTSRK